MRILSKPKIIIDKQVRISSGELKRLLQIKGEIQSINLYCGRSINDVDTGVSADRDIWEITLTEEKELSKSKKEKEEQK